MLELTLQVLLIDRDEWHHSEMLLDEDGTGCASGIGSGRGYHFSLGLGAAVGDGNEFGYINFARGLAEGDGEEDGTYYSYED